MTSTLAAELATLPLLAECTPLERARLLAGAARVELPAGATLFEAGAHADHTYWIVEGEVELQAADGSRSLIAAGSGCGAETLASPARRLATARANTPLQALAITRAALVELSAARPALKTALLTSLAAQLARTPQPAPAAVERAPARLPWKQRIGWLATLILPPAAYAAAAAAGLPQHGAIYIGLFVMTAVMWLFAVVEEYIPPLIAIIAMLFIELVPPRVALSGFYSRAFLLLLGVYALSAVLVSSGLAYRAMLWTLKALPDRPFWHRTALTTFGFVLSIVMPSGNARLALLLPLYREMDVSLAPRARSREASALMVAAFTGATLFSPLFLTAKSANLAAFTMLPAQVRTQFQGGYWLVGAALVAAGLIAFHLLAMRFLFRAERPRPLPGARIAGQLTLLGPLSAAEWIALSAFVAFLAGAALPQWHQAQTAWLAALVLVTLLVLGVLDKKGFQTGIDWPMIFFLLSLDGLTEAFDYLGLRDVLIGALGTSLDWIGGQLGWFILLALLATVLLRLVMPLTAGMVLAVTLLLPIGTAQGIHPWIVVFLASLFSDIWFLPHQNSTYGQALAAGLRRRANEALFMQYAWALNGVRVLLAYASIPYWRWLGLY
jgi:di/tricarboxylate transporter